MAGSVHCVFAGRSFRIVSSALLLVRTICSTKRDWKFNGKSVRAGQLGNELGKAIKAEALTAATKTVSGVRRPVHGKHPTDIRFHEGGGQLRVQYEACCDHLTEAVEESFW